MSIPGNTSLLRGTRSNQCGLSLIELLVALALGLIIVAALSQLFVNVSRTNLEMAKTNSQIENARFAMQFLENNVVHGGFWAGHVPQFDDLSFIETPLDYPAAVPDPCLDYTTWSADADHKAQLIGIPVQVHTDTATAPGSCTGVIDDRITHVTDPTVGNDVLVVRHAHTCAAGAPSCDDDGINPAGQLYFQAPRCKDNMTYELDPNSPLPDRFCGVALAPKRKFVQSIYYIRDWANEDSPKDGIPTLVVSEFGVTAGTPAQQEAVALVEGIERFHVEVGVDNVSETGAVLDPNGPAPIDWFDPDVWDKAENRGDGAPDAFAHCPTAGCSVYQLANTVAVKLYILARANEETAGYTDTKTYNLGSSGPIGPFNDGFKRHVFSTTVRLNNVSGRRETP